MKNQFLGALFIMFCIISFSSLAQTKKLDSLRKVKDSTLKALIHKDSLKVNKEFANKEKWLKIENQEVYPLLKGGNFSGIVPVANPTEIPDPNIDYKILFELTANNPDSTIKEINESLDEVARVINLHIASGIPQKKIFPVIVVHAGALNALKSNEAFNKKYKINNPNIKLIHDLEKIGAKFIACGQAMAFLGISRDELLPEVKISLTAQTVISSYQLKGYILKKIVTD